MGHRHCPIFCLPGVLPHAGSAPIPFGRGHVKPRGNVRYSIPEAKRKYRRYLQNISWSVHKSQAVITFTCTVMYLGYAGIAVPQVLQYLREFDAPAMQSCKPLPCGIGSCQNRRLREQTLNRKPCHCGSIKGGWCMELPTSLDQPLQGQIVCACLDMFLPV